MTPPNTTTTGAVRRAVRQAVRRWPVLAWLWLLWVVLWGSVSPVVLVSGVVVTVLVAVLFPLPPISRRASVDPLWLAGLAGHLLVDLIGSALTVAREALLRGPRVRAAVLEVPLSLDTDLLITAAAQLTTMTPGTMVLEIDRERRRFYIHSLPVRDAAEAGVRRGEVADAERWVLRALGTPEATGRARRQEQAQGQAQGEGER